MPQSWQYLTSEERSQRIRLIVGGVAVLLVAVAVGAGLWAFNREAQPASLSGTGTPSTQEPARKPPPKPERLAPVLDRLEQTDRPFNVVMIGDSTGAALKGWGPQVSAWLGQQTGRTVNFLAWFMPAKGEGKDDYSPGPWNIEDGPGPGVINVWNGSAPGTTAEYAEKHMDTQFPLPAKDVDLIFFNYGHNYGPSALVTEGAWFMENVLVEEFPNAAIVPILQNPESKKSPQYATTRDNQVEFRDWLDGWTFDWIDVWSAFARYPGGHEQLIDETRVHPTDEGYALWADVVIDRLDTELRGTPGSG